MNTRNSTKYYNEYNNKGLSGIVNMGNTCYINSAIQCLSHTLDLTDYFLTKKWETDINNEYKYNNFAKQWYRLLNGLWESNCTISPNSLFRLMVKISNKENLSLGFSSYQQNDIQEFITFVLDILHESLGYQLDTPTNGIEKFYEKKYSKIIDLFYGQIDTIILDNNNGSKLSSNSQPICFFLLPIPNKSDNINIKDCINLYLADETLEGDNKWFNEKTNEYLIVKKKIKIKILPKILILCLNRFDNSLRKKNDIVEIKESLILNKKQYSLYGICNHLGGSNGGHYIAHCKNNKEWYRFNDNIVTKVTMNFKSDSIYCLFYRQI
jgi:ubiquitin carboxyl-terminal hydrolase 8